MAKSKGEFAEGPIYIIIDYICWFFLGNLYFLLMNIPLLLILTVVLSNDASLAQDWVTPIIICCIPIGPAATALLSVMGKLIREKDINITKDFFKAYKASFFQSLFFGALEIIIISILVMDIRFFNAGRYPRALTIFIFIIIAFILLMSLYVFPIISRFYLNTKYILKTAAYYTFRKFHITILNFVMLLVIGYIFFKISIFVLAFIVSIICYSIMFYQQETLLKIQEDMKKNKKDTF